MNSALKAAWQGAEQTKPAAAISSGWGNAENDATYTVIDAETSIPHNEPMSTVTKDLLDARLEAIEARMDARVAGMSAKLDTALAEMRADRETSSHRFSRMETDLQTVNSGMAALSADVDRKLTAVAAQTADQVKTLKSNIWFAAATTIASVLAAWALAFSAFDSGRETSKSIAEATAQMKQLQMQLEAQAKVATDRPGPTTAP